MFNLEEIFKCQLCNDILYEYNIENSIDFKNFKNNYQLEHCYNKIFIDKNCEKYGYDKVYSGIYAKIFQILFALIFVFGNIYLTKLSFTDIKENQFGFFQLCSKIFIVFLYIQFAIISITLLYVIIKTRNPVVLIIFILYFVLNFFIINYLRKLAFSKNIDEIKEINENEYYINKLMTKIFLIINLIIVILLIFGGILKTYINKFINQAKLKSN